MEAKRGWIRLVVAALAAALVAAACVKAPYTGREQFIVVSHQKELALGESAAKEVMKEEKPSTDERYVSATSEVGQRIAAVAGQSDFKWEFHVVDKDVANAFCLPGGKVFVYTGLFKYARNRAELAAVIGHEVAHAVARHGAERMSMQMVAQLGYAAGQIALGSSSAVAQQTFKTAYGLGANVGVILPFSREQEYEADHIGLILMAKAGYDPRAALDFWENMGAQAKEGKKPPEYLSTHPSDAKRIAAIKELLPEAMQYYRPAQ